MTTTRSAEYVMGRTPEEYERLRRQAAVWAPATTRLLDAAAPRPGARCLDVGCGTGAVMELLAARVGPSGQVTGLDLDTELGRDAAARSGGRFVRADVESDDDAVPAGGFDLVHGRMILLHVKDPAAVLRRMWRWVAPGGTLMVQELDMRYVDSDPRLGVLDEWRRVFLGTYAAVGGDVRLGTRLPALLAEAGIGAPDTTDVAGRLGTMADSAGMLAATYRSIAPAAIAHGLLTPDRRDAWLSEIDAATRTHPSVTAVWPLLIGALKRNR